MTGMRLLLDIEKLAVLLSFEGITSNWWRFLRGNWLLKNGKFQAPYDWTALYGFGKGLWEGEDAQGYVNKMREDRSGFWLNT